MAALDGVEWGTCVLEPSHNPESERFLRDTYGRMVPPGARYFLDSPWVTRACAALGIEQVPLLHVSGDLSQMISLVVSQDNSCRYCYTATRSVMRILGFPEARIRRLEEDFLSADVRPADRAALEFARRVSRAAPLAAQRDVQALLDAGCPSDAVKEIAFFAADNVFFNRISTLPALPPEEMDFADRWSVKLMRPLLARKLRGRRAAEPIFLTPAQRQGAFAACVNALDGLPGAPRLRGVLDDAWGASTLSRRTKALIFAVVARGIGSSPCEQEACRLLEAEGMSPASIEPALAHLSGPTLDPIDSAAAGLARESIWFRPAQIQRQMRSIRSLFSNQQFVELIGLAALANMLCRLGVASLIAPPQQ
jgi:alkylhydroperoxidase family enzyme